MRRLTYITMMLGIAIMMGCGGKSTNTDANTNDSTAVTESEETKKAEEKAHGVDLGLSVNWAECNVGASAPQEFGLLTSYGNVMGRRIDAEPIRADISGTNHDIARVKLGKPWRMPTYNELMELINNCKWKHTEVKGVPGMSVTGPNGNSIFLPECDGYEIVDDVFGSHLAEAKNFDPCDYREGANYTSCYWAGSRELDMFPFLRIENGKESYTRGFDLYGFSAYAVRPVADK